MKKVRQIILLVGVVFSSSLMAQPTFEWVKQISGIESERGNSMLTDVNGNLLIGGDFWQTPDFDPGIGVFNVSAFGSLGNSDGYIQKLDASGNLIWIKQIGGTSGDYVYDISTDGNGNVYAAGRFGGTADLDPGAGVFNVTYAGITDLFVVKLDSAGNFIWGKQIGGIGDDVMSAIEVDTYGNIYTTGYFQNTVDFDPGVGVSNLTSNGDYDIFIQKLDTNGNFVWAKNIGGATQDRGMSLNIDPAGNIIISGYFSGTVDFDPGIGVNNLAAGGTYDAFTQKLDPNGVFVWANKIGGAGADYVYTVTTNANGDVITAGRFTGTVDFDPGVGVNNMTSIGTDDMFVLKYNSSGSFVWSQQFGGAGGTCLANDILIDNIGDIYVTGRFSSTIDFDPSASVSNFTSNGSYDIFIQKLDAFGNLNWVQQMGANAYDESKSIVVNNTGEIFTTGVFTNIVDFDPGVGVFNLSSWPASVDYDKYVHKMSQCVPTSSTDIQIACNTYTWIDNNTYTTSNTTATHTLVGGNAAGCDSVVTLNLTINSVDNTTTNINDSITANATGATYQWLDCDNSFAIISGATNQLFVASTNGNYAVQVTQNGCTDTSGCVNITTVGVDEITSLNLSVYPNPTTGRVTIELERLLPNISFQVKNIVGQTIETKTYFSANKIEFNLQGENGIYFLIIETEHTNRVYKILKQ